MILSLLSLFSLVAAQNTAGFTDPTVRPSKGGGAICVSGTVSVTASAQNIKLNLGLPANQSAVTQIFVGFISDGSPLLQQAVGGMQSVAGTYDLGVSLCMPANETTKSTVQFLTHGVGFDRYYWDFGPGYSYVDVAAAQGYATFLYDRLGVGTSDKPDPLQDIQSPLEVEIAAKLIQMLRQGSFGGMNFTDVAGVGHSYGSIITQGVTARYPNYLDAAVLTGFSLNATGLPAFLSGVNFAIAAENNPYRFGNLSSAFIVFSTAISNQIAFLHSPNFDSNVLSLAEATKASTTIGEIFTIGAVSGPAVNYTGAVAVVNGDADLPFCLGNCTYPTNKAAQVLALYPRAMNISDNVYIAPNTGHGINLHYSALDAFAYIQGFIQRSGL